MSLMRYEPWTVLGQIQRDLGRLFDKPYGMTPEDNSTVETSQWMPLVDIVEEPERYVLYADLPGVDPKKLEISMENNILTIKGSRERESKIEEKNYSRVERIKGTFYRRFTLPDNADSEHIAAENKNGVLEIIIPKREKARSRKIEVKS